MIANAKKLGIPTSGPNDILTQALGTPEHPGRVRAKGPVKRNAYFDVPKSSKVVEMDEREMILQEREKELEEREKMLSRREEAFKAQVSNVDIEHHSSRVQQRPPTPHSEMSSTNIRQQLLIHEEHRMTQPGVEMKVTKTLQHPIDKVYICLT